MQRVLSEGINQAIEPIEVNMVYDAISELCLCVGGFGRVRGGYVNETAGKIGLRR